MGEYQLTIKDETQRFDQFRKDLHSLKLEIQNKILLKHSIKAPTIKGDDEEIDGDDKRCIKEIKLSYDRLSAFTEQVQCKNDDLMKKIESMKESHAKNVKINQSEYDEKILSLKQQFTEKLRKYVTVDFHDKETELLQNQISEWKKTYNSFGTRKRLEIEQKNQEINDLNGKHIILREQVNKLHAQASELEEKLKSTVIEKDAIAENLRNSLDATKTENIRLQKEMTALKQRDSSKAAVKGILMGTVTMGTLMYWYCRKSKTFKKH